MPRPYEVPATQIARLIDQGLRQSGVEDQSKLAERCGVSPSYLVKVKNGGVKNLKDEFLRSLASTLNQDVEDYRIAALADSGKLPRWQKVFESQVGVRLSSNDEELIRRYVHALVKYRRGGS